MVKQEDEDDKEHDKRSLDVVYEGAPKLSFDDYKSMDDLLHPKLTQALFKLGSPSFKIDNTIFDEICMDVCQLVLYKSYQFDLDICPKK